MDVYGHLPERRSQGIVQEGGGYFRLPPARRPFYRFSGSRAIRIQNSAFNAAFRAHDPCCLGNPAVLFLGRADIWGDGRATGMRGQNQARRPTGRAGPATFASFKREGAGPSGPAPLLPVHCLARVLVVARNEGGRAGSCSVRLTSARKGGHRGRGGPFLPLRGSARLFAYQTLGVTTWCKATSSFFLGKTPIAPCTVRRRLRG